MILFGDFQCIDLNTANLIKLSVFIIDRKGLQIDGDALKQEVTGNEIDGRMFDKTDRDHFENMVKFSKRFKSTPKCKAQHLRRLNTALRKWRYVDAVSNSVENEAEEPVDDAKEAENAGVALLGAAAPPEVYEIGRRFYFWDSHRKHPDFVSPKYENMKEEVLNSPLFSGLIALTYAPGDVLLLFPSNPRDEIDKLCAVLHIEHSHLASINAF